MHLNTIKLTIVFMLLWTVTSVYGQLSKVHYIPPVGAGNYVGDQYLYISTPNTGYINVTIKPVNGNRSDWITKSIKNDEPWEFTVSASINNSGLDSPLIKNLNNMGSLTSSVFRDGYIVESDDVTYLSFRFNSNVSYDRFGNPYFVHAGAYISKGESALGSRFRTGTFGGTVGRYFDNDPTNQCYTGCSNDGYSFISIMATEDNTNLTISNIPNGVSIMNYSGSFPLSHTIMKHETLILGLKSESIDIFNNNSDQYQAFIGSLVESDKPVVVVSGSINNSVLEDYDRSNRDIGLDQLAGYNKVGSEYIIARGNGNPSIEKIYVIADSDNTELFLGNGNTSVATLNAGEFHTISLNSRTGPYGDNIYFRSQGETHKLFVYHIIGFQEDTTDENNGKANQGLVFVPPLSCSSKGNIDNIPMIEKVGGKTFDGGSLTIVAEDGAELKIYRDGVLFADNLSGGTTGLFNLSAIAKDVLGKPDYKTYFLLSTSSFPIQGSISIESNGELYVSSSTYGGFASSGSYYSGFVSNPILRSDFSVSTLGNCIKSDGSSNVILSTSSAYDSYQWYLYDVAGNTYIPAPGVSNGQSYSPETAGIYRLIGKLGCYPLIDYTSDTIVVSVCPDDFDDDGVADNLDLDIDNDGILNSVESLGNVMIDFTNVTAPVIELPNVNSPIISIATINSSSTNATFEGNSVGEILSKIPVSGINVENTYSLKPILPNDEAINLHFVFPENGIMENESEIISFAAFPSNKSISILDPGERLLVDVGTGFQRIPAEGFSGSALKLKLNESPLDTSIPVEIFGRDLTGIEILHALNASATLDGFLKFSIEIFDYKNDSDGDGVINSFELDSDDDGCNDIIEAGYEDPDNDGLVGDSPIVYDPSSGTSTADIRGRVVFAGYNYNNEPLDSDNNSIYDFQEAGTPAILSEDFATSNAVLCEGESLTLTFKSTNADSVIWEVDTDGDGIFEAADTLGTIIDSGDTYSFEINSVTTALDQSVFRARLSKSTYVCTTDTQLFTLTVNDNTTKPNLDPLTIVCNGATVADLNVENVVWYTTATGGSPLANDAILEDNTPYFAASVVNGCIGELRTETKVLVNDPVISTVSGNTTFCAKETITLSLDTNKILPTPDDFARINNLVYVENAQGPVQYDNGFYYTQQGIQTGVQPITWPTAKALGESIVGATMYIIDSTTEETLVYQGLQYMGLTGDDDIAFWLGLFQDRNASDYLEPDGGWYWVDGRPMTYQNWFRAEPNNYGNEDYGQFEFSNNGKSWNDMNLTHSGGQSYPIFEYKADTNIEWFAIDSNGTPTSITGVANSSQLEVSPLETTTYFVRVTTNGVDCDSEPFTVTINPLPTANSVPEPIEICVDDNNGAIPSADLRGSFDFSSVERTILGSQRNTNHTVAYYTTPAGAENDISAAKIQTPETFTNTSNPQTIYYRVTNTDTNCVSDVAELTIKAQAIPPTITIPDFKVCDDLASGSDEDGILRFDLTTQTATIETLLGSDTQWSITYHETVADAEAEIAITEYTTRASDNGTKTIIVRLEDNSTGCFRTDNTFNLVVNALPTISQVSFLREQCDTDTDGVIQDNLRLYNAFFSDNHANETFTYYWDSNHTDEISTPSVFFNLDDDGNPIPDVTVYVKITNENDCERTYDPATGDPLTIKLKARASTIKDTFFETYYTCLDPSVETNTGISTFDKAVFADLESALIAEHPAFANNNVTIQFFENESDAATKSPIDTSQDYVNTTPNSQEIWAAIDANGLTQTTCLGLKQVANFVVEPLAILHPVAIPRQCDGDSPSDLDPQDGLFPFDTSTVISQLLLTQNPANYEITFYDENDNVISTNEFPVEYLSPSQTIRVVVENNPSNVTPACYQESFIVFTVDDSPEVGNYNIPQVCDYDDGVLDDLGVFDTSNLNAELLAGQSNMEIRFLQRDTLGNETIIGNSLPNPFTTATTTVVVQVYNPANTTCVAEENLTFQVNENPAFDLPQDLVFCQNLGSDTIYVTNPSAAYDYAWERNGVPITTQPTQNLIISEGGTYTVTATNPVTGCATTKTVIVDASEIAFFDTEDVTIYDLTGNGNNRVEIDNSITALGIGDYEFSIEYNDGTISPYQDSPIFENVPAGVHVLYVRDKKGCGIVDLDISVIGYSFYFTPNEDGKNDRWQILGVNETFQPLSLIYIFDRQGRLMAQISAAGNGWDGTYNGTAMPADDYWFRVKLQDGRSFTGHFSLVRQ